MSERASSGMAADPESRNTGAREPEPREQPHLRHHRVVRSEDLPRFSIGTPVAAGMIIWVILLVAGIVMRDQLAQDGRTWWIWTAFAGVVLGLLGWLYITVRLKDQPGQVVEPESGSAPEPSPRDKPA